MNLLLHGRTGLRNKETSNVIRHKGYRKFVLVVYLLVYTSVTDHWICSVLAITVLVDCIMLVINPCPLPQSSSINLWVGTGKC